MIPRHYTLAVEHGEAASYVYVVTPCAGICASRRLDGTPAALQEASYLAQLWEEDWNDGQPCRGCGGDCCV